jgi:hypothetical protein
MRTLFLAARGIQGRSGKSCRLRWCNQLNPQVKRKPFTDEEDAKIIAAHAEHGNKWATIARLLPGRCGHWMDFVYCLSLRCVPFVCAEKFAAYAEHWKLGSWSQSRIRRRFVEPRLCVLSLSAHVVVVLGSKGTGAAMATAFRNKVPSCKSSG